MVILTVVFAAHQPGLAVPVGVAVPLTHTAGLVATAEAPALVGPGAGAGGGKSAAVGPLRRSRVEVPAVVFSTDEPRLALIVRVAVALARPAGGGGAGAVVPAVGRACPAAARLRGGEGRG